MYRPILFSRQKIAVFLALVCAAFLLLNPVFPSAAASSETFVIDSAGGELLSGLTNDAALELFAKAEEYAQYFTQTRSYYAESGSAAKTIALPDGLPNTVTRSFENLAAHKTVSYTYGVSDRKTEDEWLTVLQTVFSEDAARAVMAEKADGVPLCLVENGYLYEMISHKVEQGPYHLIKAGLTRTQDEAETVVFHAEIYPEQVGDFAFWANDMQRTSYEYVLKKQNGAWIFSSFRLPYWIARDTLALNASSPATGDSMVFLLPAAALSLGGVLLAAKKRKRAD